MARAPTYAEQIAQLRQVRAQAEHQQATQNLIEDYSEAVRLRDEAAERDDAASWHHFDSECESLEDSWARYYAPVQRQPQVDPRMAGYFKRKKTFLDRHGNAAANAMDMAHQYATRPRTGSANPGNTGMGLQPGTPQYFKAMDDLLEMYAGNFGLKYDPKEDTVTPNEATRISNVSPEGYNQGVRAMHQMGRNSAAEYAQQWGKKVG
jgi:hypothetical protein